MCRGAHPLSRARVGRRGAGAQMNEAGEAGIVAVIRSVIPIYSSISQSLLVSKSKFHTLSWEIQSIQGGLHVVRVEHYRWTTA